MFVVSRTALLPTDQALGARAGALLQARVRGQSRRAVLRQAPDPLRGKPGGISSQRPGGFAFGRVSEHKVSIYY